MTPSLSILVCTMPSRADDIARLLACLEPQLNNSVEVLVETDDGSLPTGIKRNRLMARAKGEYVAFIDDDDLVASDYVQRILSAIETKPDCVGIRGLMIVDGDADRARRFTHSVRYDRWCVEHGEYFRCPTHINPIRREIAAQVPFQPVTFEDDYLFSMGVRPLLGAEVFVDSCLYIYNFRSTK